MENETNPNPEELNKALEKYHEIIPAAPEHNEKLEVESLVNDILCRIKAKDCRFMMNLTIQDGSKGHFMRESTARHYLDVYLSITELEIDEVIEEGQSRENPRFTTCPLKPEIQGRWQDLARSDGKLLSSVAFFNQFSDLVEQAVKDMNASKKYEYKIFDSVKPLQKVNIMFDKGNETIYYVSLTPVIELRKWPDHFNVGWSSRKENSWPSPELITEIKQTAIYLLPSSTGGGWDSQDPANFEWCFEFDECIHQMLIERESSLPNNCCRGVVRILQRLLVDFDWHFLNFYDLKTTLLYEFESHNDSKEWQKSKIGERVLSLMRRMKAGLIEENCMNYFIPDCQQIWSFRGEETAADLDEFLTDPLGAIMNLIESHQRKKTLLKSQLRSDFVDTLDEILVRDVPTNISKSIANFVFYTKILKILDAIEKLLENPLVPVSKVGNETKASTNGAKEDTGYERQAKRAKTEEMCDDDHDDDYHDAMEVDENKDDAALLAQEMEINEENGDTALSAQEFEVVSIPSEIFDEFDAFLDSVMDSSWRAELKSSRGDEGGLRLLDEMFTQITYKSSGDKWAKVVDSMAEGLSLKIESMLRVRRALLWNGEKPDQLSLKSLDIPCTIDQHSFERLAKTLHFYYSVTITGNLEFSCNNSVLMNITSDSKANLVYLKDLRISESASLSEGACVYLATLVPFVESVTITGQVVCTRFTETLMSTCKDLGYEVKTKELWVTKCRKDIEAFSQLMDFFPFVKKLCIKGCDLSEEGIGRKLLMKSACFTEEIKLFDNNMSHENLKAMARCLLDLRSCDEKEVALKKMKLCCKSLGGNGMGADIMNLGSLIENFDLSGNNKFDADDIRRMSATLSELVKEEKEQVQLKKLILKDCPLAKKGIGEDLIKLMSLIEDFDLGGNHFDIDDLSQMNLALMELEKVNKTPICTKKLSLHYCRGEEGPGIGRGFMKLASFIEEVDLNHNSHESDDLREMCEALSELGNHGECRIKTLHLSDCYIGGKEIGEEIMKMVSFVKDVDLGMNQFEADDIRKMCATLLELSRKGEDTFRIKELNLAGSSEELKAVGKELMQLASLLEECGVSSECYDADDIREMAAVMIEMLRLNKGCVRLKKLHLRWCGGIGMHKGIMSLISLIEEIDLHGGEFSVGDLREMRADLSELLKEDPNQVRLKKLKLSRCDLNEDGKGEDLMKLGCLVEELDISQNKFSNNDLRQMSSALSRMLESNKGCVRIKKLNLSKCSLKKEYGEVLVNLIQNLEEVNLCFNSLVAEDVMLIAKFLEDVTAADSSCKDLRTMILLLSVDSDITGYARMAFFVKEIQTNSCQTAVRLLKQMAELATEFALRGRKCRLKTLKVISSLRDSKVQGLEELAQDIGVEVIVINQVDCDWIEPERYRRQNVWGEEPIFDESSSNRFKLFINGSSDETQLITHVLGPATLCITKEVEEGVEWELSKVSCDIDLAIGESILSDIISIGPEGKVFTKPAKLKIPYNIYDVPEFTEVVCQRFDLDSNQWERIIAVFSRDDNGVRYATANIHVSTKYMITLRVKKYMSMIPSSGITITPFGQRIGIDLTFPSDTFKKDNQRINFKVNKFTAEAIQHLKVLGYAISPMLHMTIQGDATPQEIINIKLPIDTTHAEVGQLMVLSWNVHQFRDVTNLVNPKLLDNAVFCEVSQNSNVVAVIRESNLHGSVELIGLMLLKYIQPQVAIELSLYGQEIPDRKLCIVSSRMEDRANLEEEFRQNKFELISTSLARQGIFKDTQMKVKVQGPFDSSAWNHQRLRFRDSKCSSSMKFKLICNVKENNTESNDVQHRVILTDDSGQILYGSLPFTLPFPNDATVMSMMEQGVSKPLRFLGLKLDDCYLKDLNLQNENEIHKLRSLGLWKKELKTVKEKIHMEGNISGVSYSWERITDAFMRGDLDKYRFANFEKLEPRNMRDRICRVVEFLTKAHCEDDVGETIFLEAIFQSKTFEQNDILTIFGRCLGLTGNDIKKIAKEAKMASLKDQKPAENHCCQLMLNSALDENEELCENNLLKIVISLVKTKLHLWTFKPESGKELAVQSLLDKLGICIEDHLFI